MQNCVSAKNIIHYNTIQLATGSDKISVPFKTATTTDQLKHLSSNSSHSRMIDTYCVVAFVVSTKKQLIIFSCK